MELMSKLSFRRRHCILLGVLSMFIFTYMYVNLKDYFKTRSVTTSSLEQTEHIALPRTPNARINLFNETGKNVESECVTLKIYSNSVVNSTLICIYDVKTDRIISKKLKNTGEWEGEHLKVIGNTFKSHPHLMFLDVGCNIGTYTLYLNTFGTKVIAIDPLRSNLQLLRKSLHLLHQEKNVTLLWNAVSDRHENIRLFTKPTSVGATRVIKENRKDTAGYTVKTITLDDLVDEFNLENQSMYLKMDVEGFEYKVLLGGRNFFRRVNVCFIAMEIRFHIKSGTYQKIFDFLEGYGLYPFHDPDFQNSLVGKNPKSFSRDCYFARKYKKCLIH